MHWIVLLRASAATGVVADGQSVDGVVRSGSVGVVTTPSAKPGPVTRKSCLEHRRGAPRWCGRWATGSALR